MESTSKIDSKASNEETEPPEKASDDDASTGRSYECMFCRRGFTTAQALGGHMNIHRKDRAKSRQPPATASPSRNTSEELRSQQGRWGFFPPATEGMRSYDMRLSALDSGLRRSPELRLFGEEETSRVGLGLGLGLGFGGGGSERVERKEEGGDVDLELRLGHHDT